MHSSLRRGGSSDAGWGKVLNVEKSFVLHQKPSGFPSFVDELLAYEIHQSTLKIVRPP
jgi:hypothetical protein